MFAWSFPSVYTLFSEWIDRLDTSELGVVVKPNLKGSSMERSQQADDYLQTKGIRLRGRSTHLFCPHLAGFVLSGF